MLWKVIGGLLLLWLVLSVAGVLIKGLFWLAVIGAIAFVATAAIGSFIAGTIATAVMETST